MLLHNFFDEVGVARSEQLRLGRCQHANGRFVVGDTPMRERPSEITIIGSNRGSIVIGNGKTVPANRRSGAK